MLNGSNGLASYLERIGLTDSVSATVDGLTALHRAHAYSIPFENLDIHLGRGISLQPEAIFDKLVTQRRGGYCFEQNALFASVLTTLGFKVRPLLARVWVGGITEPRERTHQLLLLELSGREWIADVGFGPISILEPMPFEVDRVSEQLGRRYRIRTDEIFGYMLEMATADAWEPLYSFTLERCWQADFEMGNHFTSTSPKSLFTQRRLCGRLTSSGWAILFDHDLTVVRDGIETRSTVAPGPEYMAALRQYFGIDLGVPYEALSAPYPVQ